MPKNTSHLHTALLREMILPRSFLAKVSEEYFYGLKNISLDIEKGECIGIIGSHQSGKSLLANIASGLLSPTSGSVKSTGKRLLVSKPTAGFKPSLTIEENLGFRASLMGIFGDDFNKALSNAVNNCSLDYEIVRKPIGNISPYIVKQIAFSLLMQFETDILIIDEVSHAGPSSMRETTSRQLKEKIEYCTSLVISSNPELLGEVSKRTYVLDRGEISGPYETEEAVRVFNIISDKQISDKKLQKSAALNFKHAGIIVGASTDLPPESNGAHHVATLKPGVIEKKKLKEEQRIGIFSKAQTRSKTKKDANLFRIISLKVDDDPDYSHDRYALLKEAGDLVSIELNLEAKNSAELQGAVIQLVERNSKAILWESQISQIPPRLQKGQCYNFNFTFRIPEDMEGVYGMVLLPKNSLGRVINKSLLKILIMAVGDVGERYVKELAIVDTAFNILKDGN